MKNESWSGSLPTGFHIMPIAETYAVLITLIDQLDTIAKEEPHADTPKTLS
jgi:hypothetical protein